MSLTQNSDLLTKAAAMLGIDAPLTARVYDDEIVLIAESYQKYSISRTKVEAAIQKDIEAVNAKKIAQKVSASHTPPPDFTSMTIAQLRAYAALVGVELPNSAKKAELIKALEQ